MSDWSILGDWGSSHLRLWRYQDGKIGPRVTGPGIFTGERPPAAALAQCIAPWLAHGRPRRIVLCGSVGARGGLHEAAYAPCPVTLGDWLPQTTCFELDGIPVRIAAGCATVPGAGAHSDVMRGEETKFFGAARLVPELADGHACVVMPGTHTKWVTARDGAIVAFRTFFTGELFARLQTSSLLALGDGGNADDEEAGFADGLDTAIEGSGPLGSLFAARASQLRDGRSAKWARGYLSGLLIGEEAVEMRRAGNLPAAVTVIGEPALVARQLRVLGRFGVVARTLDGDSCTLEGLRMLDAASAGSDPPSTRSHS